MNKHSNETLYYQYQFQAVNYPKAYLESLPALNRKTDIPSAVLSLNTVNAYLVSGEFALANKELSNIASQIDKIGDPNLCCHWHLLKHMLLFLVTVDTQVMQDELDKAAKYQILSGSKALECEVLVSRCLLNLSTWEITQSEETLQEAMNAAIKSDL